MNFTWKSTKCTETTTRIKNLEKCINHLFSLFLWNCYFDFSLFQKVNFISNFSKFDYWRICIISMRLQKVHYFFNNIIIKESKIRYWLDHWPSKLEIGIFIIFNTHLDVVINLRKFISDFLQILSLHKRYCCIIDRFYCRSSFEISDQRNFPKITSLIQPPQVLSVLEIFRDFFKSSAFEQQILLLLFLNFWSHKFLFPLCFGVNS